VHREAERIARVNHEIEESVTRDLLTGLPNRLVCFDRVGHHIESAKRRGGELVVAIVGLERLERVRERYGSAVGDEVLCQTADRLQAAVRASDTVGHLGRGEFLVAGETAAGFAARMVRAAQDALARPFRIEGGPGPELGAAVGLAAFPGDGHDAVTLMRRARAAMLGRKRLDRSPVDGDGSATEKGEAGTGRGRDGERLLGSSG
jgi:diguanylate cyclase (GGDEF)-like protein